MTEGGLSDPSGRFLPPIPTSIWSSPRAIEAGCHLGQGYVLARPALPPPAIVAARRRLTYGAGRVYLRIFLMNVRVQRPCVASWFMISTSSRVFASAGKIAEAFASLARCRPSDVTGPFGPAAAAAAGR